MKGDIAMDIISILAAFGGGVFGSLIGGTTAFIFTGLTGLAGIVVSLSGGGDAILNNIAFGPFFGPHVAFAGGVAAAALSGRIKKNLESKGTEECLAKSEQYVGGCDTLTPIFKTKDPLVILLGGVFGILGLTVNYFYAEILHLPIDTIAFTVLTLGIVCRLLIGTAGLFGKKPKNVNRYAFEPQQLIFSLIWSFGFSAVVAYACHTLNINNIGFVISACSLIFLYFGLDFPVTHHISMITGYATIAFGNVFLGALFGVIAFLVGEFILRTFSSYADTHIDMPAFTIAVLSFLILGILS